MAEKEIKINGKIIKSGQIVSIKAQLIGASGTGGKGFNLQIALPQGGVIIKTINPINNSGISVIIDLINISPDQILLL